MSTVTAFLGARIFDGDIWREEAALLVEDQRVIGVVPRSDVGPPTRHVDLGGGILAPGLVDLQVNGGGGVLFNNAPDLASIETICAVHAQFGTTAVLPTLITDTADVTRRAIAAGIAASRNQVPGFLGLHLEGPHLSLARKGTHDPSLIRPMSDDDLAMLIDAARALPHLLCTVAPESVRNDQIAALSAAGAIVSLGHSDTGFDQANAAFDAGATMVTHLFNAMSQLGSREPGIVGAALTHPSVHAGLIVDGIHVHPATLGLAMRARQKPETMFLVTDSMSQTGTDLTSLTLNGRIITRADGALRLEDGTLAGADLDMIDAMTFMHRTMGVGLEQALRMASLYPARAIGADHEHGRLESGCRADFVHLDDQLQIQATYIGGACVFS